MKTLLALALMFSLSFAQTLKPVHGINSVSTWLNTASVDGVMATLPCPTPTSGTYALYFDLGYWLPANTLIQLNVYGNILPDSKVMIGAISDYSLEGFSHVFCDKLTDIVLKYDSAFSITHSWSFPVRFFIVFRQCSTTASRINPDGSTTKGVSEYENGYPAYIDAVTYSFPQPKCIKFNTKRFHYFQGIGTVEMTHKTLSQK